MGEGLRSAHLAVFKQKVLTNGCGCWIWQGAKDKDGYGIATVMVIDGKQVKRAHRITFYLSRGYLPRLLDHVVCNNPTCCNPDHLEPSTDEKNVLRGSGPTADNSRKTHCPKGHEYDITTTYKGRTRRNCSVCLKERKRAQAKRRYARSQAHKSL